MLNVGIVINILNTQWYAYLFRFVALVREEINYEKRCVTIHSRARVFSIINEAILK
jgi:hypothetical protein